MKYKALKKMKFDKEYALGEFINVAEIAPDMVRKLIACNMIAEVGDAEQPKGTENKPDSIVIVDLETEAAKGKKPAKR